MDRKKLTELNILAHKQRPDPSFFKSLDSTVKKNSAFVKKLKTLSELPKDQKETLISSLKQLNFKRYISEATKAIAELNFLFEDTDLIVEVICVLHQNYEEFTNVMMNLLFNSIPKDIDDVKFRVLIKILSDLYILKVYNDPKPLYQLLENMIKKMDSNNMLNVISIIVSWIKYHGTDFEKEKQFMDLIDQFYKDLIENLIKSHDDSKKWQKLYNLCKQISEILKRDLPEFKKEEKVKIELPDKFETEEVKLFYEDIPKLEEITKSNFADENELFEKLNSQCMSKTLIVDWCQNFIFLKVSKKKLEKYLFGVHRTSLELLPYYSKLVAILNPIHKEIGKDLIKDLIEEFEELFKQKNQMNIESKIKNIRFLGELTKFKILNSNVLINCLSKCLEDFTYHNIEITYHLLETCGRFLYCSHETHEVIKELLNKMWRFKEIKNYDLKYNLLIENCYYLSKAEKIENEKVPVLNQYISYLIHDQLNKNTSKKILKKIRQLNIYKDLSLIISIFRDNKCKYSNISLLASLISGLTMVHEFFGVYFIDLLIEDIRLSLIENDHWQKRIFDIKLLGELYNYQMIEIDLIFDILYSIILHSPSTDLPQDTFRIRLICTLLDTCSPYFDEEIQKKYLNRFILYLQRYILSKGMRLPIDVEYTLADTLEKIIPNLIWPKDLKQVSNIIDKLDSIDLPGDVYLWEIKKVNLSDQKKNITVLKEEKVEKKENKLESFEKDQLERELQQLMEESSNQRKTEIIRPKKEDGKKKIIILKK